MYESKRKRVWRKYGGRDSLRKGGENVEMERRKKRNREIKLDKHLVWF